MSDLTKSLRIVREKERFNITGIPRSTWWELVKAGHAPKPVPLTTQTSGYVEGELYQFNDQRIAERDAKEIAGEFSDSHCIPQWEDLLQRVAEDGTCPA